MLDLTPQQAQELIDDLQSKLTEEEKEHPGTAWYLSQLDRCANREE